MIKTLRELGVNTSGARLRLRDAARDFLQEVGLQGDQGAGPQGDQDTGLHRDLGAGPLEDQGAEGHEGAFYCFLFMIYTYYVIFGVIFALFLAQKFQK